jgi:O-antigen/teichoic acid export membrane protein
MRFFYECEDAEAKQRLASTIFFFLLAVNGILLAASLAGSDVMARWLFDGTSHIRALQLTLLNTFAIGFTFFPFHLLRMDKRSVAFSALTLARSVATVVLRLVLIIGFGYGVLGVILADVIVTAALLVVLVRWFAPLFAPVFSMSVLRETVRFGLPRVPHAFAQQVMAVGDRFILKRFRPVSDVGIYTMGVSFGLTQKLFLSAFEYAWAPFYYANSREPDAPLIFSRVTTLGLAVLTLITAGLSATGGDLLEAIVGPEYEQAADVVTWTAVGVLFQGAYLLTSIGLNITKHTEYYPASTIVAAAANVGLNFALVPRFGMMGAAWANAAAYALQAGLAYRFSQRFFPVQYETSRIARVAAAGLLACLAARALPDMPPVTGVLVRGSTVVGLFAGMLWATGVLRGGELDQLRAIRRPRPAPSASVAPPETTELAGEIVAAELPDQALLGSVREPPAAGKVRGGG